jgi:GNAT superfamily N-acetyltransferase
MNLDSFIDSKYPSNVWIQERNISVYVRKSNRYLLDKKITSCLDLASVEVEERHRGKGIFTAFLSRFEKAAHDTNRVVYVESILEPRLREFLKTKGYAIVPGSSEMSPSMYKVIG